MNVLIITKINGLKIMLRGLRLPSLVLPLNFGLIYLLSVKLMEIIVKLLLSFSDKLALLTRR